MKQTILSKCFSKMKRVALTLFAALCVGNVWAATFAGDSRSLSFDAETKTVSFGWNCYLYDTFSSYKVKAILEYGGSTTTYKVTTKEFVTGRWHVMKFDKTLDDFELGDVLRVTFSLCYGNSDANIDNTWGDDSFTYTVDTRGVLTSDCKWDVDTKKFILSGKVAGDGIKGVKVKYKISDAELAELPQDAVVENAEFDSVASTYKIQIPYVNEKSYLNWSVYAVFDNEEKIFKDPSTEKEVLSERQDEDGYIEYTWVGSDDNNLWSNSLNWDENLKRSLKGVPGYVNHAGHHTSIACFTNSATVNLGGGTYRLYDYEGNNIPHRALRFIKGDNENMVVKFTNGNLQINDGEDDNSNPLLGADGVTVEFADGGIYKYPYQLAFAPGTTIIFSGNSTQPWKYNPANKGEGATTFIVRNGNVLSSYSADGDASATHTAIIENGVWMIDEVVSRGIANVTKFVDGENQAKIALGANANGKTKTLKLTGTFEFTFAENQMSKAAYILPHSLVDGSQNATFKVDATAYKSGAKVPMVAVAVATDFIPKLQVFANGVDVTSARNAKLVWNETEKTLYFQQDSQNAAEVAGVEYATFAEAFDAAQAGETVKLLNDVTLAEKLTIKKAVTLDLNGCTLSETVTDNYGALYVGTAGNLTITDSAEGGKIATDGGVVVGNYGTVTVNGGTIEAGENPKVDVSVYNFYYNGSTYGRLTVTGGTVGCIWNCGAVTVSGGTVDYVDTTGEMTVAQGATIGELLLKVGDYNSELPNKETLVAPETFVVKTLDGSCALYRDGKWVVVDATDNPFLVGETGYATLAAAFDAVDEGGVITLLSNVTGPGLVINKSVTIDFNNKTYTFDQGVGNIPSNGFQILKDNTVTLKNGTLQIAESAKETFYTVIQNYANLTLNNMTVDATNADKWSTKDGDSYAVSINCGTVSIEGATTITANDEGDKAFAFDVCKYDSYTPPTVTLNTTGTISGKVEVSGGAFVIGAENTATLSAIDFTAGSVKGDVEDVLTIPEDKKLVETEGVYTLTDKDVLAKVGDKLFETIAEAFAAAQAGDAVILEKSLTFNDVLQIPANVTLDLNGNELQALAVVGKLSMNGGALKTYDTNTQTYFFMAAPEGTAALYWTSDAVMTIGADYSLSLDGGSVTLPASWRSLLGQSLTIKSGASFVIPTGVELNLRGNAVVESGATLTCEGTIALGNTYDAVDTSATLTSAQLAEGKVTSKVEGYRVVYANGVYSLEEIPAEFAAQVGDVKYATLQAALDDEANLAATITLIANTKENVTVPTGFTGTIDLGGFTLTGRIDSYATGAVLKNGSVIHTTGSKAAIQIEAGSLELTDINMESNYHGVRLNAAGTTATINSGTYRITSSAGTYNLIYANGANAKFYVYGGEFYNNNNDGSTYVLKAIATGSEINVYGGTFNGGDATTFENANGNVTGLIKLFGGTYTGCNPSKTQKATVQPGYAVEGTGPWTVVVSWTAPLPEKDGDSAITEKYTLDVLEALEAALATSVDVKVNGVELKGDEAIKALNTAVASFDDALTFDGTAAILDIVIEVTEVNTEDPAASTVVVKSGTEELTVKATPTVKYIDLATGDEIEKPTSGAVIFKIVFEAPVAE